MASALPSSIDQNFRLDTVGDESFVLKISNSSELPEFLDAQVRALEYLAAGPPIALRLPVVTRRPSGDATIFAKGHLVWLVGWLEGKPVAHLESKPRTLLQEFGRALGELDERLAGFDDPAVHREFRWDLMRAPGVLGLTTHIPDPEGRQHVLRSLRRFATDTIPRLERLPFQVVHNDANDHNLLVRPAAVGESFIPCALLDFGDLLWTPRVAEAAIAITYAMLGSEEPIEAAAAFLGGYHASLPIGPDELGLLPDLIEARLCASVTIAAYERACDPDNAFVSVSEAPAWRLLERLAAERFRSGLATALAETTWQQD
ncbi:MAG: phosphotransferase [marine benthic group bacterium]|nr:phosphotransferase [Gemmatimonadota bacterium]MCL7963428.1 phosphotransferase [Candidatus Carthagonibacter metallireducens]MCL7936924.1 phosphotransferase [Gemmatimonadota bacterium]MCL7965491.1 phosphotransferase [Gemmatimonadota bacterium]MCL7969927.1 phosphotransferase [Gemmatimonadota bacterium]